MNDGEHDPYPKTTFGRAIRSFWHFVGHHTGTGSWVLRPLHKQLLDALLSALEDNVKILVERQLTQPFYMQFWHKGRISPFFFYDFNLPAKLRISNPEFADRLYKVEMFVDGRKQQAHVTFYRGRIHCLEFKKPFKFYEGKDIRFGAVTVGKPKQSMATAIDRQEHGKDGRHATGEE
jgi:hypothetical protein